MFLTNHARPSIIPPSSAVLARARIARNGTVEAFDVVLISKTQAELEASVDTLEAQIGTVLSLVEVNADGSDGDRLYKSMVHAWEV